MYAAQQPPAAGGALEVLRAALALGCSSFGGPIAHLGFFERAYVQRKRWLSSDEYAGIVGVCQLLPGPTSSQVGFLVGLHRAGWAGAFAAWFGFTLPSAILMYAFAVGAPRFKGPVQGTLLHGLKLAAVAIVAQAVWSMAKNLCPDFRRAGVATAAAAALLAAPSSSMQFAVLGFGAVAGLALCRRQDAAPWRVIIATRARSARWALAVFALTLTTLPLLARRAPHGVIALADIFYRSGSLVFGGGHVVLPLLREALVPGGWISDDAFLAGYGAAQALPGPLFTLAAYLGAACAPAGAAAFWAAAALLCIFLPGLLLAVAGLALWAQLAKVPAARAALAGVNAVVVGILAAALYRPVLTSSIASARDVAIALTALVLLLRWRTAPVLVVLGCVGAAFA